jgi:hypothetical protein
VRHRGGQAFGVFQGQLLGHQLAQDQRQVRDTDHYNRYGDWLTEGRDIRETVQIRCEALRDRGAAEDPARTPPQLE